VCSRIRAFTKESIMKKFLIVCGALALTGAVATGCSSDRRVTTTRETIQTVPADPVVTERRTTTHTETRTGD
jgi:hypothetical protein